MRTSCFLCCQRPGVTAPSPVSSSSLSNTFVLDLSNIASRATQILYVHKITHASN
jgi:hypothetical protein